MRRESSRAVALLLVVVLVSSFQIRGVVAQPPGGVSSPVQSAGTDHHTAEIEPVAWQVNETNATRNDRSDVPHHLNPNRPYGERNVGNVLRWLRGRLLLMLHDSVLHLRNDRYAAASNTLTGGFRQYFSRYVAVASTDPETNANTTGTQIERVKAVQRDYVTTVRAFWSVHHAYRDAIRTANETRARTLARRLGTLGTRVNRTEDALLGSYENVTEGSVENGSHLVGNSTAMVQNITHNVTNRTSDIQSELFVETNVEARSRTNPSDFLDPLVVTGRVTDRNGTAIPNGTVLVSSGPRSVETTTRADGTFSTRYRPTIAPLGESNLTVQFVPSASSAYLGSNATVLANVTQRSPSVNVSVRPGGAQFNETVTLEGSVRVSGIGADTVPVDLWLADRHVGTVRTGANGSFTAETTVPLGTEPGTRSIRATLPLERRALDAVNASTSIVIRTSPTSMRIEAIPQGDRNLRVTGRLSHSGTRPVANGRVGIVTNGTTIGSVRTGPDGRFATNVVVPASVWPDDGDANVTIAGVFDATGTNLVPVRSEATVRISRSRSRSQFGWVRSLVTAWRERILFVGFVGIGIGMGLYLVRERRLDDSEDVSGGSGGETTEFTGSGTGDGRDRVAESESADIEWDTTGQELLDVTGADSLQQRLSEERPATAVKAAYTVVRRRVGEAASADDVQTHKEFLRACERSDLSEERVAQLTELIDVYERTMFASDDPAPEDASAVLEAALDWDATTGDR